MLRVDTRLFFRSTQLRDRLCDRSNTNVCYFHTLIIVDFERFVYHSWWTFDGDRFVGTLASSKLRLLILWCNSGLFVDVLLFVAEGEQVSSVGVLFVVLGFFIQLDRRQQLFLCKQSVNLLHELESGVLFIQNQCVNRIKSDWDSPAIEEELQLVPVITFAAVVLGV